MTETKSYTELARAAASRVADYLATHRGRADAAALRRLRHRDPGAAFPMWRVATALGLPLGDDPSLSRQRAWSALLSSLAVLADTPQGDASLGRALSEADVSELRVMRLLEARNEALFDALRHVSRQLASRAIPVRRADLADLVLTASHQSRRAERVRRTIARDYYATEHRKEGTK